MATTIEKEAHTGPISDESNGQARVAALTRTEERRGALVGGASTALAEMTEADFEAALDRAKQERKWAERIFNEMLVEGAHFGNPKQTNGRAAFKKPILFQAGAEVLEKVFGLRTALIEEGEVVEIIPPALDERGNVTDPGFVSVTVRLGIMRRGGPPFLAETRANCNSREKRFKSYSDGAKWTYTDAREVLNDCLSMARKRGQVRLVRAALCLTPWLANEDEMEKASEEEEKPITPWTADEKAKVFAAASAKGMGRKSFGAFVETTLGTPNVGTGPDVKTLLDAIAKWEKPVPKPQTDEDILREDQALAAKEGQ